MKKTLKIYGLLLFMMISYLSFGQTKEEKANEKKHEAIKLEDEGKVDDAIKLLEEARKLAPKDFAYPYELGYAYYVKKDFKKAIKYLDEAIKYENAEDLGYQLLGNSYDKLGDSEKAIETYKKGLKVFPNSGKLYLEQGNVYWTKKEFDKALPFYEKGIEIDPRFPSNYYRATRLYCSTTEKVWGMIYGEIFLNLERNSKRTSEISKLLYDTYESQIKFKSEDRISISFSEMVEGTKKVVDDLGKSKLPYGVGIYEPTLLLAIVGETKITLASLHNIRTRFVESYFKNEYNKTYPNILFDYQNKMLKAGHLDAYNHWVLMKGAEEEFTKWQEANKGKWDDFIAWFKENKINIDKENKFYREQY